MAFPAYARATASSTLKITGDSNHHSPSSISSSSSASTKSPKRPSTITRKRRQSINYKSDLYHIRPQDPNKACHLTNLPSELRTTIYQYVLSSFDTHQQPRYVVKLRPRRVCYIWPHILHVSRAIRIEAAYVYYTNTAFNFSIRNLNFALANEWLADLPPQHRALLQRNRHLTIDVNPVIRPTHTYPPSGWLLDAPLSEHWKSCAQFGNLYSVATASHQLNFILFCRLMSWFYLNDRAPYRGMRWQYILDTSGPSYSWTSAISATRTLTRFLCDTVSVLGDERVMRAWTRARVAGRGKREAIYFLEELDSAFHEVKGEDMESLMQTWDSSMERLKDLAKHW